MIAVRFSPHGLPRRAQSSNQMRRRLSILTTRRPSLPSQQTGWPHHCRCSPQVWDVLSSLSSCRIPMTHGRTMSYSNTRQVLNHTEHEEEDSVVVYESPFAGMVNRLRAITLLTALAGSVGLPAVVALKGTVPSVGFVALCLSFGTGSLASTAAIHYVFSPYVFYIERM